MVLRFVPCYGRGLVPGLYHVRSVLVQWYVGLYHVRGVLVQWY